MQKNNVHLLTEGLVKLGDLKNVKPGTAAD